MTRADAWTSFASAALATIIPGSRPEDTDQRARLAGQWADAMTEEWSRRFGSAVVEEQKRRKG